MSYDFSPDEQGLIQNSYISKTYKQIAFLLDCPEQAVKEFVESLNPEVKSRQQKIDERKASRPKKVPKKERLRQEKLKQKSSETAKDRAAVENQWRQQRQGNLNREPRFTNKAVDYNEMVLVKIDKKTSFYVKRGENIEAAKKKFIKLYAKSLNLE